MIRVQSTCVDCGAVKKRGHIDYAPQNINVEHKCDACFDALRVRLAASESQVEALTKALEQTTTALDVIFANAPHCPTDEPETCPKVWCLECRSRLAMRIGEDALADAVAALKPSAAKEAT